MIDYAIFSSNMVAFADRIGRPLGAESLAMYYETLSRELDTEAFQRGIAAMFRDHKFNTWPAPTEIIDRAMPSKALTAAAAWSHLEESLKRCEPTKPLLASLRMCGVEETALATFMAVGGLARWRRANDFRAEEMRDEFMARYEDMQRLPQPQQHALTAPRDHVKPGIAKLSDALRLPGVAPYSPGDAA